MDDYIDHHCYWLKCGEIPILLGITPGPVTSGSDDAQPP